MTEYVNEVLLQMSLLTTTTSACTNHRTVLHNNNKMRFYPAVSSLIGRQSVQKRAMNSDDGFIKLTAASRSQLAPKNLKFKCIKVHFIFGYILVYVLERFKKYV